MTSSKKEFNLVLGSRPQLRLPIISDEDDKIYWYYIPNDIADGNIFVKDGDVGIGTQNPQAKLHVVGNVIVEGGTIDARVGTYESSLEYFGCVRDGVTDDTPCFQAALDSGISEVIAVPGTYNIAGTLFASSPVTIRGWREDTVVLKTANTQNPLFVVESPGVTFEDLTILGSRAYNGAALSFVTLPAYARQSAIAVLENNARVERCSFENFPKGISAANVLSLTIDACAFDVFHTAVSTTDATDAKVSRSVFSRQNAVAGETLSGHAWKSTRDLRPAMRDSYFENFGNSYAISMTDATNGRVLESTMANVVGFALATDCAGLEISGAIGSTSGTPAVLVANGASIVVRDLRLSTSARGSGIVVKHASAATIESCALQYDNTVFDEPPYVLIADAPSTLRDATASPAPANAVPVAFVAGNGAPVERVFGGAVVGSFEAVDLGSGSGNVVCVDPRASANANVVVFSLAPSAGVGLSNAGEYYPVRTIPQHADSTLELDTVGGLAAVSLWRSGGAASTVDDPASYSHRLNVPPLPGNFRLFGKFYVESAFAPADPAPLFLAASSSFGAPIASASVQGTTISASVLGATGAVTVAADAWHDLEMSVRDNSAIRVLVNGATIASANAAVPRPLFEGLYIGSEQGIWTTGLTHEVCDPILRNSATVRGDARMVGNVAIVPGSGGFSGDGSLVTNLNVHNVSGNVECTFM